VKGPRHIITPYNTNSVWEALEPLLTPQRKDYRVSWLCGRSWGEKSFAYTNEGVFIAKGGTDPRGCSTTLMTIWLPWLFNFTWLFVQQVGLLDFHITLHCLTTWPIVEMWVTWLDMTMLVHSCCCWSACRATMLLGVGCLHGVSQLHLCMARCTESLMVICSLDVALAHYSLLVCWKAWQVLLFTKGACSSIRLSVSTSCMFSCSSIREYIFAWSSVHEHISSHASFICLLVNLIFGMCSLRSLRSSSPHVFWCTCTCSHS